ncbi:MAG: hypothetical protein HQ512_10540 [Rhodospirillales bacterium]|nr:hypothetical protein [Rhodospirillales bacterium]
MRIIASIMFMGFLAGCSAIPGVAQIQGLTVVGTDKTIEDHLISYSSGKNCSTIRKERGLSYCEEDEPMIKPPIYCYKTLARVTCYDRPDPHRGGQRKLGDNEHNMPK